MAAIKASANLFALLDGNDPGDKRLADFDPQKKDEPKKKPVSAAACDYKLKLMKPPAPAAWSKQAPRKNPTPAATAGLQSSAAAAAPARAMTKQTATKPAAPPARSTNYTGVLFAKAYPSARERISKERQQRKEEYERRQAEEKANSDDKSVAKQQKKPEGQPEAPVKKANMAPVAKEPAVAPVVLRTPPPPPPSIDDINQFPSLK